MRQFGTPTDGSNLRMTPRHAVFGIATKGADIACVAVKVGSRSFFDLPGGGVKPGESEEEALVREFAEETGLKIRPQSRLAQASQYFRSSSGNANVLNLGGFWTTSREGFVAKSEANHRLRWLDVGVAITSLRHESHAWFVLEWLRWNERDQTHYRRADAEDSFRQRRRAA